MRPQRNALRFADGGAVPSGWTSFSDWDKQQADAWKANQGGENTGAYSSGPLGGQSPLTQYDPWLKSVGWTGPKTVQTGSGDMTSEQVNPELTAWLQQQGYTFGRQRTGTQGGNAFTSGSTYVDQAFDSNGNPVGPAYGSGDNNASALQGMAAVAALAGGAYGAGAYGAAGAGAGGGTAGAGAAGAGAAGGAAGGAGAAAGGTGAAGAAGAGMSTFDWVNLAANLGSGLIQSDASKDAAAQIAAGSAAGQAAQQRQYDQNRADNMPFLQGGYNALADQQRLAKQYEQNPISYESLLSEPGYQFGLKQGVGAVDNSAAARGGLFSGAAGRAVSRYATDYATTKLTDAFNRINTERNQNFNRQDSIRNGGQVASGQIGSAGQNMVNQNTGLITGNANAQGANQIAQGNIWSNQLNNLGSQWNQYNQKKQGSGGNMGNWGTGSVYGNEDMGLYLADGGPVRREPKVGTRSPLPSGGGGGMSRDAILQELNRAHIEAQAAASQPSGMGALPADPLRQPGKVRAIQGQQAGAFANGGAVKRRNYLGGGAVTGPGGPRDDVIPMWGSNGEHMINEPVVTDIGGGNNERGQATLNQLRELPPESLNQLRALLRSGAL